MLSVTTLRVSPSIGFRCWLGPSPLVLCLSLRWPWIDRSLLSMSLLLAFSESVRAPISDSSCRTIPLKKAKSGKAHGAKTLHYSRRLRRKSPLGGAFACHATDDTEPARSSRDSRRDELPGGRLRKRRHCLRDGSNRWSRGQGCRYRY